MANEIKEGRIGDLTFDDKNFNKGTQYGQHLMSKSLQQFGAGRSILVDKNGRIIAGNKTAEAFGSIGLENIKIVKSSGEELVVVQRDDIDLDTPEGREFALADNQTAKVNIDFDFELIDSELENNVIEEWGIDVEDSKDGKDTDSEDGDGGDTEFTVTVKCHSKLQQEEVFYKLTNEGYDCKVSV